MAAARQEYIDEAGKVETIDPDKAQLRRVANIFTGLGSLLKSRKRRRRGSTPKYLYPRT
jgi:hypothetical protein